jgi:hypothetical protein
MRLGAVEKRGSLPSHTVRRECVCRLRCAVIRQRDEQNCALALWGEASMALLAGHAHAATIVLIVSAN